MPETSNKSSAERRPCTCGETLQYMPEDVMAAGHGRTHYYDGRPCVDGDLIADRLKAVLSPEDWAKVERRLT